MKIIGITGGIGSGKSTVLEYLSMTHNARVIQADETGHQVMEPGEECYAAVCALFGTGILSPDGRIDRKKLGSLVFGDNVLLGKLNAIVHPAVRNKIREQIEAWREENVGLCIVEAALLLEGKLDEFCDEIWYVYADPEVRIRRLEEYRHETRQKVEKVMRQQKEDDFFRSHADVTIDNSGSFAETKAQIENRLAKLIPGDEG